MTLSVIGAGFGRTGTLSLKLALETLGLGPCHHMEEVFTNPAQLPYWQAAIEGRQMNWDQVYAGFASTVDWPGTHYWRDLAEFYPQAKVILSVRPTEVWCKSFSATIRKLLEMKDSIPDEYVRSILDMAYQMIAVETFGDAMHDEVRLRAAFQQRIDEVTASIDSERLLVFDVAEGWEPLCRFLDRPVPDVEFPNINNQEEFWKTFGGS